MKFFWERGMEKNYLRKGEIVKIKCFWKKLYFSACVVHKGVHEKFLGFHFCVFSRIRRDEFDKIV